MVTVNDNLTNQFLLCFSLNSSDGCRITPPWTLLESHRIISPASHLISTPLPINGSLLVSSSQSEWDHQQSGYLPISYFWTSQVWLLGTTIKPPTSSTLYRGIIPCTQWKPGLAEGFWSTCRFSTQGVQDLLCHHGRQAMNVSKLLIRFGVLQILLKVVLTAGRLRRNQLAREWAPPQPVKKPMSGIPGQLSFIQVVELLRSRPLPRPSSQSQNRPIVFLTYSWETTFLTTTTP